MKTVQELIPTLLYTVRQAGHQDSWHRLVYDLDSLDNALEPSWCEVEIDLYRKYQPLIADASVQIEMLSEKLSGCKAELRTSESYRNLNTGRFDVFEYLSFNSLRAHLLLKWKGPLAQCFIHEDKEDLLPLYLHYPQYRFYVRHRVQLGEELFLSCIEPLRAPISSAHINDQFVWDDTEAWSSLTKLFHNDLTTLQRK